MLVFQINLQYRWIWIGEKGYNFFLFHFIFNHQTHFSSPSSLKKMFPVPSGLIRSTCSTENNFTNWEKGEIQSISPVPMRVSFVLLFSQRKFRDKIRGCGQVIQPISRMDCITLCPSPVVYFVQGGRNMRTSFRGSLLLWYRGCIT